MLTSNSLPPLPILAVRWRNPVRSALVRSALVLAALSFTSLSLLAGCGSDKGAADSGKNAKGAAKESETKELTPVDRAEFAAVIEKHRGKVVLVDFWAMWCTPCKEKFPHTLELAKKYGERGLAVVAFSMDDYREPKAVTLAQNFLVESKAQELDWLIARFGPNQKSYVEFDLSGTMPTYRLYDRRGNLKHEFENELPEDFEAKIEELLREEG